MCGCARTAASERVAKKRGGGGFISMHYCECLCILSIMTKRIETKRGKKLDRGHEK